MLESLKNFFNFIKNLNKFNKIVLFTAIFILIISLIIVGILLSFLLMSETYPPVISDCPDYWDVSLNSSNETICINLSQQNTGLGTSECTNYNTDLFLVSGTDYANVLCEKYKWANDCDITWDGITNNNQVCKS